MYRQYAPTLKSTIGNDLTGTIQGGDHNDMYASGVFTYVSETQSVISTTNGAVMFYLDKVRFSGSSGTCSLLHLKPRYIKGGNHSHSRGTIGNDLTGRGTFNQITEHEVSNASGCLSFGSGSSHPGYRNSDAWYNGAVLRFSGSSGFTGSVLEWPALYSQPCNLRSLDHSRGTIGNDLTGRATLIDPDWMTCTGVFSSEASGSWKYAGGGGYSAGALRFSGSSGMCSLLHLKRSTLKQATTATAEAR